MIFTAPLFPFLFVASLSLLHHVDAKLSSSDYRPQRLLKGQKSTKSVACDDFPFSNIFVFGDSLSDQGNLASIVATYPARAANNGKFAVEHIADYFGLVLEASNHLVALSANMPELITGNNYAVVSAMAAAGAFFNTPTQVDAFMLKNPGGAPSDALYIVMVGSNDVLTLWDDKYLFGTEKTDDELFQHVKEKAKAVVDFTIRPLMEAGAQYIVMGDVPPLGITPFVNMNQPEERITFTTRAVEIFNNELELILSDDKYSNVMFSNFAHGIDFEALGLQTESPCTIGHSGVKGGNPVIPPLNGGITFPAIWDTTCSLPHAPGFGFWDELHPSAAAQEDLARQIINYMCIELHPGKGGKSSKGVKMPKTGKTGKTSKESKTKDTTSKKMKKSK